MSKYSVSVPVVTSISNQVYLSIKKSILQGEFQPGQRLLILEIAHRFQTSQAPVRESLERLKQEGLVEGRPNKGALVTGITHKEIQDVYLFRQLIEAYAMHETYKRMTPHDFEALAELMQQMNKASEMNDPLQLIELDMEFHGFFYSKCDNQIIAEQWERIKTKIMRFIMVTNQHYSGENIVLAHEKLLKALQSDNQGDLTETLTETLAFYKKFV